MDISSRTYGESVSVVPRRDRTGAGSDDDNIIIINYYLYYYNRYYCYYYFDVIGA